MSEATVVKIKASDLEAMLRSVVEGVLKDHINAEGPELLSTAELAKTLGVSDDLVRHWVRVEGCPHVRVGKKKLRFRLIEVLAWLKERGRA